MARFGDRAIPSLTTALYNDDPNVRQNAVEALRDTKNNLAVELKDDIIVEPLIIALKNETVSWVSSDIVQALEQITGQHHGSSILKWQEWWHGRDDLEKNALVEK